ncbi:ComF family protein [soil metagenome]
MVIARCLDAAMAVLFAPFCAACAAPLEAPSGGAVCDRCWTSITPLTDPLCETCGDGLPSWRAACEKQCIRCRRLPRVISRARAVAAYEGRLRDILHALKYGGRRSVARPLSHLMAISGARILEGADFVVPVPLHLVRSYRRGFNQAADLAADLGVPAVSALRRVRRTATQTNLPETERHRNVLGAFVVTRRARQRVRGSVIVVIDDVSTTGATLDACARVLLDAGALEVRALTAARAASKLQR